MLSKNKGNSLSEIFTENLILLLRNLKSLIPFKSNDVNIFLSKDKCESNSSAICLRGRTSLMVSQNHLSMNK